MTSQLKRHADLIRGVVAVGGLAAILWILIGLPPPGERVPHRIWSFFVGWCLVVPYWHFLEYRLLMPERATADQVADFRYQQTLSRAVWAAFALVLAVVLLRQP